MGIGPWDKASGAKFPTPVEKKVFPAGRDHVTQIRGDVRADLYRREPCEKCPWRKDATGVFSPEAFKISACTAKPDSVDVFACHSSGPEKPTVCAGFLLRGSARNALVRLQKEHGLVNMAEVSSPVPLYNSYHEMAIANGVPPNDPCLE